MPNVVNENQLQLVKSDGIISKPPCVPKLIKYQLHMAGLGLPANSILQSFDTNNAEPEVKKPLENVPNVNMETEKEPCFKTKDCQYEKDKNVSKVPSHSNIDPKISDSSNDTKKWNCGQCDSTFKNRNKLIFHLKSIKENVPAKQCMICPFKSCSRKGILSHMEKSHVKG